MTPSQFIAWRTKNHLTQQQVADGLRISRQAVCKWTARDVGPGTSARVDVALYAIFPEAVDA